MKRSQIVHNAVLAKRAICNLQRNLALTSAVLTLLTALGMGLKDCLHYE